MASGKSNDPAQIPVMCNECEVFDIKLKCLQCDLYLCQQCSSSIHSKSKFNKDHFIIDLKDLGSIDSADLQRKFDLENLTCSTHQGKKCVSFCIDCARPICMKCIRDKCQSHNHEDLCEKYESKYSKIKAIGKQIINDISFYDNEKKRLEKSLYESRQQSDQLRQQVEDQKRDLKVAIDKFSQNLLQQVDDIYNPGQAQLKEELKRIQKTREDLKEQKRNIVKILLSYQASDVLNEVYSEENTLPEKVPCDIQTPQAKFIQSELASISMNEVYGSVHRIPEFKLSQSYQTNLKDVFSIVHSDTEMKFISSFDSPKLQKVKAKNDRLEVIKEESIQVNDMDMMDNGDLLISSGGSELKLYTKSGTLQTYKTFPGLLTLGVHENKHKAIVVGLSEPTASWSVSKDSIRQVVVHNQSGNIQHTYEYDKNNQRLFTGPIRIVTFWDKICVVDILNDSQDGRVVVIDYRGQIQWVFSGCGDDSTNFYPRDIAVTSNDTILVSEEVNHVIHVLTLTGEVVVCHNVEDLGIEIPLSLAMDTSGLLWVGCGIGKNDKLHVVKLY